MATILDDKFFRLAYNMALKSSFRVRVGAVVRSKRVVLAAGYNQRQKTHPLLRRFPYWPEAGLHAEMHACLGLSNEDLADSTLYVLRLLRTGEIAASRPCEACIEYLAARGVKWVVYAIDKKRFGRLRLEQGVYAKVS